MTWYMFGTLFVLMQLVILRFVSPKQGYMGLPTWIVLGGSFLAGVWFWWVYATNRFQGGIGVLYRFAIVSCLLLLSEWYKRQSLSNR